MTDSDLAALLETVACKAPALRNAGVQSVSCGIVTIHLAPPDMKEEKPETAPPPRTALEDPALYPGGHVPGFEIGGDDEDYRRG